MGKKLLRHVGVGVGAGMQQLGQGMMEKHFQDKADARADARLEKTDAFKDRELSIRESDLDIRQKAAKRQQMMDGLKTRHGLAVQRLVGEKNFNVRAEILSTLIPGQMNFTNNEGAVNDDSLILDGKKPYAVFDISYNDTHPETGEIKPDPTTGKGRQVASVVGNGSYKGRKVFYSEEEYLKFQSQKMDPAKWLAIETQKQTAPEAIELDNFIQTETIKAQAKATASTEAGAADIDKTKSEAEKNRALATKAKADAGKTAEVKAADDTVLKNFDGSELRYNRNAITVKRDELKTMQDDFPGMNLQEKVNYEQGMPEVQDKVRQVIQDVVNNADDQGARTDAIDWIKKTLRVKRSVAEGILEDEMKGIQSSEPTWWERLKGSVNDAEVAGS